MWSMLGAEDISGTHASLDDKEGSRAKKLANHGQSYRIPLTRNCNAELQFDGEVSTKAIDTLVRYIALMKDVWAEE